MDFDLKQLRILLRDVPKSSSFSESLRLLEDAFTWLDRADNPPWAQYRRGGDIAFFGEYTLQTLLGEGFRGQLADRLGVELGTEPSHRAELRLEMQLYAVVGRRNVRSVMRADFVIFHSGQVSFLDGAEPPRADALRSMELVRVRAGLMNHRQARLLANHLNLFRRNHHYAEALDWSVVRGPVPNSSARAWLNAVAGESSHLQHTVGEAPVGGLGPNAIRALALYVVKQKPSARAEQVFSYDAPRCLLPERFAISAVERVRSHGIPAGMKWLAVRASADQHAKSFAEVCERAGLIDGANPFEFVHPGDLWGSAGFGAPEPDWYTGTPSERYAVSFTRDEVLRVMHSLRAHGYRGVRAHRFGSDGRHVQTETDHWTHTSKSLHPTGMFETVAEPKLQVKLFTVVEPQDRYTPWECRAEWEREALTAAQEARDRAIANANLR